jgi:hypothetical protein
VEPLAERNGYAISESRTAVMSEQVLLRARRSASRDGEGEPAVNALRIGRKAGRRRPPTR